MRSRSVLGPAEFGFQPPVAWIRIPTAAFSWAPEKSSILILMASCASLCRTERKLVLVLMLTLYRL